MANLPPIPPHYMPCAIVESNVNLDVPKAKAFINDVSKTLAKTIGKPEAYCMAGYNHCIAMLMGGSDLPCAFINLSSIGNINAHNNNIVSKALSEVCTKHLEVPADRVYINFNDVKSFNWGYNGATF